MRSAILGLGMSITMLGSAHAVTFTSTAYDTGVPMGQTILNDFDHPVAAGYTFTFRGRSAVENSSISGFAVSPAGDTSTYAVVPMDSYAYLTSKNNLKSASVYLGSIDSYNYVAFLDNNILVAGFSGSDLVANANGDQRGGGTNRLFDFNFGSEKVNEIAFGSMGYSSEFDNIAVSAAPEPSTWLLMIAGIGDIGLVLRRVNSTMGFRFKNAFSA